MILREYLAKNNMEYSDFAVILDYNASYLCQIGNGLLQPGRRLAKLIEQKTNGEVTVEDLRKPVNLDGCCKKCGRSFKNTKEEQPDVAEVPKPAIRKARNIALPYKA